MARTMLNRVNIMGRIVRDLELRHTGAGTSVTQFTIAVDRDFKDKDGNRETDFIDCVAWRNTAEFICTHFAKGRLIVLDGKLQIRKWVDKNGNNRYTSEVIADSAYFADSKSNSAPDQKVTAESEIPEWVKATDNTAGEDDFPF